jgi:Cu-processing system permease protein
MIGRMLLRWELQQSLRSYWFLANAGVFVVGGLLLMVFGQTDVSVLGYRGFARALAALVQLALFFVPLMALFPSTAAIAGDRELGTLDYLLAQPVTRGEVYSGKWAGVTAAMVLSLSLAFAVTGSIAAAKGVPTGLVAALLGLTVLLSMTFVSAGMWISAAATSRTRAVSVGLTVWLVLVALGSLGLMSAFVRWGLPAGWLQAWALLNPVEAYRLAAVAILSPELELLGPAGAALLERFGRTGLVMGATGSMLGWAVVGYAAGRWVFGRAGA